MRPDELSTRLHDIEAQGLHRQRRVLARLEGAEVEYQGRRLLNFCSNDYLGLANHPAVVEAFQRAALRYGVGSGASHLVCGHGRAHHALEEELAEFTGRERVLLFSTGYMANLGVIAALVGPSDSIFEDRLNHASLLDGAVLSGARLKRFAHADADGLAMDMAICRAPGRMIVTDGVFSMDGDLAPLPKLVAVARTSQSWLMVDDAHGLGVLGAGGLGVLEHFGLTQDDVPVLVGTLGKALGTFGAFVAGSRDLIDYLIQRARTYAYTTAFPPAIAEATRTSLRLVREESWRRERLCNLVRCFRAGATRLGLQLLDSMTPIQPIVLGSNEAAVRASQILLERGILVTAIRPPTVPTGTARLRITLSAAHREEDVDRLLEAMDSVGCTA